jgi:hypothetical protein
MAPAKVDSLNRIGLAWMGVRPTLTLRALHPNVVAGMASMFVPFLLAALLTERSERRPALAVAAGAALVFVLFTIVMTTSRGAWLALTAGLVLWLLWGGSGLLARSSPISRGAIFLVSAGILFVVFIVVVAASPGGLVGLAEQLPGPSHTGSRIDLARGVSYLVSDFPFTGGGLDSFPGLYGQYVLVSPFYIVEHGHNMFLDITLEQGLLGGLALLATLGISIWLVGGTLAREEGNVFAAAALTALIVMVLHGLVDDSLYGSRAQILLWVAPAVGLAAGSRIREPAEDRSVNVRRVAIAGVAVFVFVVYAFIFRDALGIVWRTNLGAVRMAQAELADFPTGQWADGSNASALTPAAVLFEDVIRKDPTNQTARYRLGQIGLLIRNFNVAVEHLEAAYRAAPNHPGIRKSLAYAYAWTGRTDEAAALLLGMDDVNTEVRNYSGWWRSQGREDLAAQAETVLAVLEANR